MSGRSMGNESKGHLDPIAHYYASKLALHGQTPLGVDWNGAQGQLLRFEQLIKLIADKRPFTINDLGCGYGALFDFLADRFEDFRYSGTDISPEMIEAAKARCAGRQNAAFQVSPEPAAPADYSVASGIFNVRLDRSDDSWLDHIKSVLDSLHEASGSGFGFNCLTSYSDSEKMRDYLYYANPLLLFDFCKRRYSRNVALLHDYGLYEFTILVRKNP